MTGISYNPQICKRLSISRKQFSRAVSKPNFSLLGRAKALDWPALMAGVPQIFAPQPSENFNTAPNPSFRPSQTCLEVFCPNVRRVHMKILLRLDAGI